MTGAIIGFLFGAGLGAVFGFFLCAVFSATKDWRDE